MRYEILNDSNEVINTIIADDAFVEANYPNKWRKVDGVDDLIETATAEPTKEQLMVELAILTAKIQALE